MGVSAPPHGKPSLASVLDASAVILAVILILSPTVFGAPAPMPLHAPQLNLLVSPAASLAVSDPPAPQGTDTHLQKV